MPSDVSRRALLGGLLGGSVLRGQGLAALPVACVREVERLASTEMSRQSIPGLSLAVGVNGALALSAGYGMADLENFVPATAVTAYRTASIAKSMTAVAVMQLVEAGRMDLDATVQRYVAAFPEKAHPVTIRHLLSHQAGIRHYRADGSDFDSTRHHADLASALLAFRDDPLEFEPGTRFLYSTYGYVLLGAAVEAASGMAYRDYLQRRILAPARMERTRVDDTHRLVPQRARGYRKSPAGEIENAALADTSNKVPGGGLVSTAEDLVRFAQAVQQGVLVSPASVERLWAKQRTRDGQAVGYGLGWDLVESADGLPQVGHTGGQQGTATVLRLLPGERVTVAVMCNLQDAQLAALVGGVQRAVRACRGTP